MIVDILKIIKKKSDEQEALSIVYREPDGSLNYYHVIPYLVEPTFFQGLTNRGTFSFQYTCVIALEEQGHSQHLSWRRIKSEKKMIVLPGARRPVYFQQLTEEEKYILMRAVFTGKAIIVADYIIVEQGER
ncbi:MAG: hypothetical protein ACOYI2_06330 [Bacillota bacterium]|jgi:hypothetical protein